MTIKSIRLEDELVDEIKNIAKMYKLSFSDYVRFALKNNIVNEKKSFAYRIKNAQFVSEEENNELNSFLDNMSDDELKITKKYELKI